jgi:peptidoglycan/xylan/chitin deacetylase (PgdA/CDA1 family)
MSLSCAVQSTALQALGRSGLPALFAHRYSGIGAILAFHRVRRVEGLYKFASRHASIDPETFCRIILGLRTREYDFVNMEEAVRRIENPSAAQRKFVCLTFDDGFEDTYTEAFRICRTFGIPMAVYVITGVLAGGVPMWWLGLEQVVADNDAIKFPWRGKDEYIPVRTGPEKRRAYIRIATRLADAMPEECRDICAQLGAATGVDFVGMTVQQSLSPRMMAEMQASGLVEFGAHSVSHTNLRRLEFDDARREIAQSRRELQDLLGVEVRHFAYPYGAPHAAGPREFALCRALGFRSAVTTRMDTVTQADRARLHALPRLMFNGEFQDTPLLDLLLSGTLPKTRAALQACRRVLGGRTTCNEGGAPLLNTEEWSTISPWFCRTT